MLLLSFNSLGLFFGHLYGVCQITSLFDSLNTFTSIGVEDKAEYLCHKIVEVRACLMADTVAVGTAGYLIFNTAASNFAPCCFAILLATRALFA